MVMKSPAVVAPTFEPCAVMDVPELHTILSSALWAVFLLFSCFFPFMHVLFVSLPWLAHANEHAVSQMQISYL